MGILLQKKGELREALDHLKRASKTILSPSLMPDCLERIRAIQAEIGLDPEKSAVPAPPAPE